MKKISLQWRLTLMTSLLIAATCIILNVLLYHNGIFYMDSLTDSVLSSVDNTSDSGDAVQELYINISPENWEDFVSDFSIQLLDTKHGYGINGWLITAIVTVISGMITYFISGRALKPLHDFSAQVEKIQAQNLTECEITEHNIPEFEQLRRSFNQMLKRLSNAFERQRQFTGNAAHEFRTPLALMQAKLDLYANSTHATDDPETIETLAMMQTQTERLSRLVKILLEMSELETIPRTDQIALSPLIEEVLADLSPLAEKRDITLLQPAEPDITICGSDILIYQVVFNLTENAVRYNRENGSVTITAAKRGKDAVITVSDTGPGISEEFRESVFEPFFRVDKSRSRSLGGVGLGLALVHEITTLHGGTVQITESSENGTVFEVCLPLAE